MLLVHSRHEGGIGRDSIGTEEEQGLFGCKLNPLADNIVELADGKIGRNQILLLVNFGDVAPIGLLADYGNAVGILGPDPLGFRLSLFWEARGAGMWASSKKKAKRETSGDK